MDQRKKPGGWRANLMKIVWLPVSLVWGAVVLTGMSALDFVFRHKQKLRREEGLLWGVLSVSYWLLAAVFTGEWRWRKHGINSTKAFSESV